MTIESRLNLFEPSLNFESARLLCVKGPVAFPGQNVGDERSKTRPGRSAYSASIE